MGKHNSVLLRPLSSLLLIFTLKLSRVLTGSEAALEPEQFLRMMAEISEKVEQGHCDAVMETAWTTLWNVTDVSRPNCERFLAAGGMSLFLRCKVSLKTKMTVVILASAMFRKCSRDKLPCSGT